MIIAVNTRLRKNEQPEGYEDFIFQLLHQVTSQYPQHRFLYIFDKPYPTNLVFANHVTPLIAGPETSNRLRLQYWFNYKIAGLIRKHKADVFVSMEGICSLRSKIPQLLMISDCRFLQYPNLIKKSQAGFFKKFTPAFLTRSTSIAAVSDFSKSVIADQYKINTSAITVIKPIIDELFKPVHEAEKELIKETYSEGKAYFLFSGHINLQSNLVNLLKAFSFFKKRQKSNMMLLIAGNADDSFKKELKTYKFRHDVILLENLLTPDLAKITAAAYALVYPVLYADFALPPLQAMQCGVPVIATQSGALPSICGEAALYIDSADFKDIAENMMLIFKDEQKAGKLIQAGHAMLEQNQRKKSADLFMQSILKAITIE